jgi:hypothetical protein
MAKQPLVLTVDILFSELAKEGYSVTKPRFRGSIGLVWCRRQVSADLDVGLERKTITLLRLSTP